MPIWGTQYRPTCISTENTMAMELLAYGGPGVLRFLKTEVRNLAAWNCCGTYRSTKQLERIP